MFLPVGSVFLDVNYVCSTIAIIAMMFFLSGSLQNIFLVNVDPSSVEARQSYKVVMVVMTLVKPMMKTMKVMKLVMKTMTMGTRMKTTMKI